MKNLIKFIKCESATTAVEYALLAALISVVAISAFDAAGLSLTNVFKKISTSMAGR